MLNFTNEYIKYLFVQITSRSVFCFLTKEVKWGLKGKTVTRRIKSEKQTMKISNTKIVRRKLFIGQTCFLAS